MTFATKLFPSDTSQRIPSSNLNMYTLGHNEWSKFTNGHLDKLRKAAYTVSKYTHFKAFFQEFDSKAVYRILKSR